MIRTFSGNENELVFLSNHIVNIMTTLNRTRLASLTSKKDGWRYIIITINVKVMMSEKKKRKNIVEHF